MTFITSSRRWQTLETDTADTAILYAGPPIERAIKPNGLKSLFWLVLVYIKLSQMATADVDMTSLNTNMQENWDSIHRRS